MGADAIKKHICVCSTILISLCYCYFISSRIRKGFLRLISLFPILCLFTILPLFLPTVFFSMVATSLVAWLPIGRLMLLAFGKGPLSPAQTSQSLYNFITSAALPVRNPSSKFPSKHAYLNHLAAKVLAYATVIGFIAKYNEELHPKLLLVTYGIFLFLYLDCLGASSKLLFHALLGLDLEPMLNEPYLSTSLQEFWGRRWNLIVSNMIRQTVYKPLRSASVVVIGNVLAPAPAYLAAFLVSGLMHELLLSCLTRVKPSWEMTAFFVLHGICVVMEFGVKKGLKGRLGLPRFVSVPLTVGFVILTSIWLFFPAVIREGVDAMLFREFRSLREFFHDGITFLVATYMPFQA